MNSGHPFAKAPKLFAAFTAFSSLFSFDVTDGSYPEDALVEGPDGNFYGTTDEGGTNEEGTVFKITTNGVLTTLLTFDGVNGSYPSAGLILGADGNFYGTTDQDGSNTYYGTIFRMATNGVLTTLHSFDYSSDGAYPQAGLIRGADGEFYGTASGGGTYFNGSESVNATGTLFKITTNGTLTTLVLFVGTNGQNPQDRLLQGADGSFYGTTSSGGISYSGSSYSGDGVVFRFGAVPAMQPPSVIAQPAAQIVPLSGSAIFSVTAGGAVPLSYFWSRNGVSIAGATSSTYVATNVQLTDSGSQFSCLVSNVYGSAYSSNAALEVFTGSGPLFSFNGLDGGDAITAVTQGTDGYFYGATSYGGANRQGSLFRVSTNGQLATLVSFNSTNGTLSTLTSFNDGLTGGYPMGLIQGTDGNFYGTTEDGGTNSEGTVFRMTTNGTLTSLFSFNAASGSYPSAALIQAGDGNFYGTTSSGGSNKGYGTVFQVTTNGTLTTLHSFDYFDGGYPYAPVMQGADGNLYGTTEDGGANGAGTLFRITTTGVLSNLYSFAGSDGCNPQSGLAQDISGNLYCPTASGGTGFDGVFGSGNGTVFRLAGVIIAGAPVIGVQPAGQTLTVGATAAFSVNATGSGPLDYFWMRNGAPIAGATLSSYVINNVQLSDSDSQFSCLVSNAYGTALSSNAPLTVVSNVAGNLVQNGGFELGSFAYWTLSGNSGDAFVTSNAPYVHSGMYGAELGPVGSLGYISQTIATTDGQTYLVSCWLLSDGEVPNEFSVSWNGATLFDHTNMAVAPWANLQFLATATVTNTALAFGFRDDPGYLALDDISVSLIIAPHFQSVTVTNRTIQFSWNTEAGQAYQVQYTTNLAQGQWTLLGTAIPAVGSSLAESDSVSNLQKFYRVVLLP